MEASGEIRSERNYAELAFEAGAELSDSWFWDYDYFPARHLERSIKFDKWMDGNTALTMFLSTVTNG